MLDRFVVSAIYLFILKTEKTYNLSLFLEHTLKLFEHRIINSTSTRRSFYDPSGRQSYQRDMGDIDDARQKTSRFVPAGE